MGDDFFSLKGAETVVPTAGETVGASFLPIATV